MPPLVQRSLACNSRYTFSSQSVSLQAATRLASSHGGSRSHCALERLTLGFVFRAFSAFCEQKALMAFFSSLGAPPNKCFRRFASVKTRLMFFGFRSMLARISARGAASGIQSPPPVTSEYQNVSYSILDICQNTHRRNFAHVARSAGNSMRTALFYQSVTYDVSNMLSKMMKAHTKQPKSALCKESDQG